MVSVSSHSAASILSFPLFYNSMFLHLCKGEGCPTLQDGEDAAEFLKVLSKKPKFRTCYATGRMKR